ncbi:LysR family transcriptional regulator [Trinickia dinghuensis]|uniref:LysR family transcriptional regulator n=1 Tax=Trinickia dinghuensis TaxID=2291023 RepID=A0A3D8JWZ9_9BURK|nr:LysR family transcriptional regulator [Trinickia dinghuensis]RDU97627.1 LysR family transcriptional regulator [Trinickia dinghuensis]
MIDLNELQFFARICEAQSFTVAAERLGVPKSSVSRALTRLETRLGVRLIERTTRSLMLTEAGELYLERCMRMLEEVEQADLAIGAMHAKPRGLLRVATSVPFARFALGPVLGEFLALYPDVRVEMQFLGGEYKHGDAAADIYIRPDPIADSTMRATPLFQVRLALYASPAYLAGRPLPKTPADLREHHCVSSHCCTPGLPAGMSSWRLRRGASSQEVRFEPRVSVADPTIGYLLAMTGTGIAQLNQHAARADVGAGRLVRLLPDWEVDPIQLYALHASRLNASPKVSAFLNFLRERFNDVDVAVGPRPARASKRPSERQADYASRPAQHAAGMDYV